MSVLTTHPPLSDVFLNVVARSRRFISVLLHAGLIVLANLAAFWLRFDGDIPADYWHVAATTLPFVVIVRMALFVPFRLFEGLWKYTSLWDLRNIILGVSTSTVALYAVEKLVAPYPGYPRLIYIIDALLLVLLLSGVRMSRRLHREFTRAGEGRKILIYGAGDAGEMVVRDMRHSPIHGQAVGFVDDDRRKNGARIHGIRVLGGSGDLASILRKTQAEEVLIAIPSASPQQLRNIVRKLEPFKVRISTLPRFWEVAGREVGVAQIRRLRVEDLLAREPVKLDSAVVTQAIGGKRVLVTGAGGSIGSELCMQLSAAGPAELVMLDRYENTLYTADRQVADAHPDLKLHAVIADVTDQARMEQLFVEFAPQVVFHAAAHKHVPLMERQPSEAIKNNVRGTRIVAEAARKYRAERFILISTDKAVKPTSVMGAAKRVAELMVTSMPQDGTRFVVVRFGNVLASNGSVVPLFLQQIGKGGPVTLTHPDMRRYFMLISEAVQLVLHAGAIGDHGSILVLDMGEQLKVADIARDLIRLAGYIPDKDIELTYTGIRPGEKLEEELVAPDEGTEASSVPKIMKVNALTFPMPKLDAEIQRLERAALSGNDDRVVDYLYRIVPSLTLASSPSHLLRA